MRDLQERSDRKETKTEAIKWLKLRGNEEEKKAKGRMKNEREKRKKNESDKKRIE